MMTQTQINPICLAELDLEPILGLLSIVRMPAAKLPELIVKIHANPDTAILCMQMFYVLLALGNRPFALDMQAQALQQQRLYRIAGTAAPTLRLLALMGPGDMLDNTPLEFLLEHSDIRLDLLFLVPGQPLPAVVPDHDVAMVAIGESGSNAPLLQDLTGLLASWPRPVLNRPQNVLHCARHTVYQLLKDVAGLHMPVTERRQRQQLNDLRWPVTIRPVDTQGGHGLAKLEEEAELHAYLAAHHASEFYVAQYLDYRSADGWFRKMRIALIDGAPYLCHLAISSHWMVHYHGAAMDQSAPKRAEEAALMASFDHDFAVRHGAALGAISTRLGLDYVVLDCAQAADGGLLLFEADSRGWIHATDPVDIFPYKAAVMQKAFAAFRAMLRRRC